MFVIYQIVITPNVPDGRIYTKLDDMIIMYMIYVYKRHFKVNAMIAGAIYWSAINVWFI